MKQATVRAAAIGSIALAATLSAWGQTAGKAPEHLGNVEFPNSCSPAQQEKFVRGVAMLAASSAGLAVAEYAPLSIKSAVVGYGRADKEQVQHMITRLLNLAAPPDSPDAADALAIAITHAHHRASTALRLKVVGA